jgi:CubicO group peptidase (beta-lactamase class C family)
MCRRAFLFPEFTFLFLRWVLSVIAVVGVFSGCEANQRTSPERYLEDLLRDTRAPSISVAVAVDGEVALALAVGYADVENEIPATVHTRYRTYSITKAMTGIALMQLQERGALSLADDVRTYLPEVSATANPIRLVHLATHTSGILDVPDGAGNDPLEFEPGTDSRYSSDTFNLLAGVIESASGDSYTSYLRQHLFAPADMTHSDVLARGGGSPGLAEPYALDGWRMLRKPKRIETPPDLSAVAASAAVVSTPTDLVNMLAALEAEDLLARASINEMFTPPFPDVSDEQAIGWYCEKSETGEPTFYASGRGPGFTAYLLHVPHARVTGALLVNVSGFDDRRGVLLEVMKPYLSGASAER